MASALREDFDELVRRLVEDYVRDPEAVKALMRIWVQEHLTHLDPEVRLKKYEELFVEVMPQFLAGHVKKARSAMIWDAVLTKKRVMTLQTVVEMLITWGDSVSDMIALEVLLRTDSSYAAPVIAMLIFAHVAQAACTRFFKHQGPLATFAALLGLSPLVDGFGIILGIDETGGQYDHVTSFAVSRATETALESTPQLILQALALAELGAKPSTPQYVSVALSVLSITYTFASVTFSMDTSERQRTIQPRLCVCLRSQSSVRTLTRVPQVRFHRSFEGHLDALRAHAQPRTVACAANLLRSIDHDDGL